MRDAVMATLLPTHPGLLFLFAETKGVTLLCTPSGCATRRPCRSATCNPGSICGIVLGRRPVHGRLRRQDHVHFRATLSSDRDETPRWPRVSIRFWSPLRMTLPPSAAAPAVSF